MTGLAYDDRTRGRDLDVIDVAGGCAPARSPTKSPTTLPAACIRHHHR
jgi:hypothetical protein